MTFIMKFKDNLKSSFLVATFRHCLFTPTMTVYKGRYEFSQKPLCLRCRDHLCHRFPIPLNHRLRRMGIKKVNWTVYFWYQVMSFEKSSYGEQQRRIVVTKKDHDVDFPLKFRLFFSCQLNHWPFVCQIFLAS